MNTSKQTSDAPFREESLLSPNKRNPEHRKLMRIFRGMCEEFGMYATLKLVPVEGKTEATRHNSKLRTMGMFFSRPYSREVIMPECAAEFFSRGEIEAVLAHEFGHLKDPELSSQKTRLSKQFKTLDKVRGHIEEGVEKDGRSPNWLERGMMRKTERTWDKLSAVSTKMEIRADENAIRSQRASDSISALQKLRAVRTALLLENEYGSLEKAAHVVMEGGDEGLFRVDDVVRDGAKAAERRNPRPHTSESFRERLARFEKAAENEPERPCRGR